MTGVISLLIDRDKNISVDFVKTLIKESSKKLSNAPNADYGIVDYGYAASIYDRVEKEFEEGLVETEEEKDIAHTDDTIENSLAENTDTFAAGFSFFPIAIFLLLFIFHCMVSRRVST